LEGQFGFLESFCGDSNPRVAYKGFRDQNGEMHKVCLKAFPCHVTSHTSIESLRTLMQEHAFDASQVREISIEVSEKVLSHHVIRSPNDIKQAQYSLPFCVAWALHVNPYQPENMNPSVFDQCRDSKNFQCNPIDAIFYRK
jgi:2-methylcitrate dehydratase PrpD